MYLYDKNDEKIAIVMDFIHSKVFATPERTDNLRT